MNSYLEASGIDFDGKPVGEIILVCGFFLIYAIEELVMAATGGKGGHGHSHGGEVEDGQQVEETVREGELKETESGITKVTPM